MRCARSGCDEVAEGSARVIRAGMPAPYASPAAPDVQVRQGCARASDRSSEPSSRRVIRPPSGSVDAKVSQPKRDGPDDAQMASRNDNPQRYRHGASNAADRDRARDGDGGTGPQRVRRQKHGCGLIELRRSIPVGGEGDLDLLIDERIAARQRRQVGRESGA